MKTQIQISAIMMFRFIDCGLHATMFFASDCNFVQQPFNDKTRQATIGFGTLTAPLIRMGTVKLLCEISGVGGHILT